VVPVDSLVAGLCYHDILIDTPVYQKTLTRIPEEMREARMRRIRRAIDLNVKKIVLSEDEWTDPWREYNAFQSVLEETQREEDERAALSEEPWFAKAGDTPWFSYDLDSNWFWRGVPDAKPKAPKLER
jgi:hypothetical protein